MSLERRIGNLEQRAETQDTEADELSRLTDQELMSKSQKLVDAACERAGCEPVTLTTGNVLQVLKQFFPDVLNGAPAAGRPS
jgi:hypothetical protein